MEEPKISLIEIDVSNRTICAFDIDGNAIVHPLSPSGAAKFRYAKVSTGGHLIQALTKMLERPDTDRFYGS